MRESLSGSKTPEDALIKCSTSFTGPNAFSGLEDLLSTRLKQKDHVEQCLIGKAIEAELLKAVCRDEDHHYSVWKRKPIHSEDEDTERTLRKVQILAAQEAKAAGAGGSGRGKVEGRKGMADAVKKLRELTNVLRELSRELLARQRSYRFIANIKKLQELGSSDGNDNGDENDETASAAATRTRTDCMRCDKGANRNHDGAEHEDEDQAVRCPQAVKKSALVVSTACGHVSCTTCLAARRHRERCVVERCGAGQSAINYTRATDLGSRARGKHHSDSGFGEKLNELVRLLLSLPAAEQAIIFVQNQEVMSMAARALAAAEISFFAIENITARGATDVELFKSEKYPRARRAIILNLTIESAAGVNLPNANHVVFLSPMLTRSQSKFDAAMIQAVGRARRYGQTRRVRIYYFVALRTIDVDVLQQRQWRNVALTTASSSSLPTATALLRSISPSQSGSSGSDVVCGGSNSSSSGRKVMAPGLTRRAGAADWSRENGIERTKLVRLRKSTNSDDRNQKENGHGDGTGTGEIALVPLSQCIDSNIRILNQNENPLENEHGMQIGNVGEPGPGPGLAEHEERFTSLVKFSLAFADETWGLRIRLGMVTASATAIATELAHVSRLGLG